MARVEVTNVEHLGLALLLQVYPVLWIVFNTARTYPRFAGALFCVECLISFVAGLTIFGPPY